MILKYISKIKYVKQLPGTYINFNIINKYSKQRVFEDIEDLDVVDRGPV